MAEDIIYHIVPASGGEWAIQTDENFETASVHPTQGLAVATVWELARERTAVEVVVHGPDGSIVSNLSIRRFTEWAESFDEAEDEALRREAMRIMPSRAELDALIDRLPLSTICYDEEDNELPC